MKIGRSKYVSDIQKAATYKNEVMMRLVKKDIVGKDADTICHMIGKCHSMALGGGISWEDTVSLTNLCLRAPDLLLSLNRAYGDEGINRFLGWAIKFKFVIPKLVSVENDMRRVDNGI